MKKNSKFLFPVTALAVTLSASALLLNACQKDTTQKATTQTTNNASMSSAAAAQFDETMDSLARKSLVAWYSFDSGSLKDRSKHHNDIIFSNATSATDRYGNEGNAYYFDGKTSYMKVKDSRSINPKTEITLLAIIKVNGFYAGPCHGNRILNKGNDDYIRGRYSLGFNDNYHTGGLNCSQPVQRDQENFEALYGYPAIGKAAGAYDTGYVHKNRWYRLAFTYANGVGKMYVNGRLMTYTEYTAEFGGDNGWDLFIGQTGSSQYPYWFNGVIDELAMFNQALSDEEIASLSKP